MYFHKKKFKYFYYIQKQQ